MLRFEDVGSIAWVVVVTKGGVPRGVARRGGEVARGTGVST